MSGGEAGVERSKVLKIAYDETVLEWTGVEEGEYGGLFDGLPGEALTWFAEDPAVNETEDGVFCTLVFRVKDDAPLGTSQVTVRYDEDYVYNADEENQAFAVVPGELEIISYIPGDINGEGSVNNKDVVRLQRFLKTGDVEIH